MEIGRRLRELRIAKGYSQGDIEKQTGLLRCYVSRVENGHITPSLDTLQKWAHALNLELYQVFFMGDEPPVAAKVPITLRTNPLEERLLERFRALDKADRTLLLGLAKKLCAFRKPKR